MNHLKLEKSHLCGLSMGGLTVLYLAIHHPERVKSLILANTGAKLGNQALWQGRIAQVKEQGMAAIADDVILRWFSKEFLDTEPDLAALFKEDLALMSPEGYIGCCYALAEADLREELNKVICPTLIIAGKDDEATPVSWSKDMLGKINLAKILILNAAHLSNIEKANAFNKGVKAFLK